MTVQKQVAEMNKTTKLVAFWFAYFGLAALVGGLVAKLAPAAFSAGLPFGVFMGILVVGCSQLDQLLHKRYANRPSVRSQLSMVMLIYVALPAAVMALAHVFVPALVVFGSWLEVLLAAAWMPLFLASLLEIKKKII